MALTVPDLLEPKGRISVHLFPGESAEAITGRVTEYLTQATALAATRGLTEAATVDRFARAWAYHLAFDAAATRLVLLPATQNREGEGGSNYLASQLTEVRRLADVYRAEADGYLASATSGSTPPQRWVSTPVALTPVW